MRWKMPNGYMLSSHTVMEFRDGEAPFGKLSASNTGDGTYGCVAVRMRDMPGELFLQVNNYHEAKWWLEFLNDYPDAQGQRLIPAPDQSETSLPFLPPLEKDAHLSWTISQHHKED